MILKDVWREIREDLASQSFIRFGHLRYSFLHSIEENIAFIAIPSKHLEEFYSEFMENAKFEIKQRIAKETGLRLDICFNSDLF